VAADSVMAIIEPRAPLGKAGNAMQGFQQAVGQNPARLGSGDAGPGTAKALYVGNLHPFVSDAMLQVCPLILSAACGFRWAQ